MPAPDNSGSDRITVIALVLLILLLVIVVAGIAYLFYVGVTNGFVGQGHDTMAATGTPTPASGLAIGSKAYICQDFSPNVTVLDADTGSKLGEIHFQTIVLGVTASHDGKYAYFSGSNCLYIVDAKNDTVVKGITLGQHGPTGLLAISSDDQSIYVACDDGIEAVALNHTDAKPVAFTPCVRAMGIGITPDGRHVLMTEWANCSLQVYNTSDHIIEKTIDLIPDYLAHENLSLRGLPIQAAGQAGGIAVSPDGSRAIAGIWYGTFISVVDLKTMALDKAINMYRPSNRCAVYSPDGSLVYLMCYDYGVIFILNSSTLEELKHFYVGSWPVDIAITPDGEHLYVTYQQSDMDIYSLPDGACIRTINNTPHYSGTHVAFVSAAV